MSLESIEQAEFADKVMLLRTSMIANAEAGVRRMLEERWRFAKFISENQSAYEASFGTDAIATIESEQESVIGGAQFIGSVVPFTKTVGSIQLEIEAQLK